MARRLGRVDLESAALDAVTSAQQALGRYGAMEDPIRRRLDLVSKLTDPYEIGDIHAMGAWWAVNTGRYRAAIDLASGGFDGAMPGSPLQAIYCLDFRVVGRFRLGDWDGALADVALAEELLGSRRERPPGFAAMHLAIAAFVHDARGDRSTAGRYHELVRWLDETEDLPDPALSLWQARMLARRGRYDEARALLERPPIAGDQRGQDEVLEAWCEVISEEMAWEEAPGIADRAARLAEWAGEPPLALYATRLRGRASVASGDLDRAGALLRSAAEGFDGLDAVWEAAITRLDLARALAAVRHDDAVELAGSSVEVFERLGSVREVGLAREVLGRRG